MTILRRDSHAARRRRRFRHALLQALKRPLPGMPSHPRRALARSLSRCLAPVLCTVALAFAASVPPARAQAPAAPMACLILPERVAELGSPVVGVIEKVEVDRGDAVTKGQVLATLRADVERAQTGVVRSRADSEAEYRAAAATRDLAQLKLDRAKSLAAQNFVSAQAVEQAESEFRIAKEKMLQTREQLGTQAREVGSAQALLAQRVLRAPFDGVITERYLHPGERVEDKPLLKIAVVNRLRVELVAPAALFGTLRLGQTLGVQPELAGFGARDAKVTQIDRVLEPASNTFRVRAELANEDGALPAGMRCKVLPAQAAALAAR